MNIKQIALVLGATVALVGGGMGAAACSSSSSGGNGAGSSSGGGSGSSSGSSGGMDSGDDSTSSGSSSGGSGSSSGSMGDGGMGPDCGKIPTLHPNPAGDVYCGFTDAGSLDCVADSGTGYCCLGGEVSGTFLPEMCAANAAGCTNGGDPDAGSGNSAAIPIQCGQISDCPTNGAPGATACCITGGGVTPPTMVAGCGYDKSTHGAAVVCEGTGGGSPTDCQAGEVQICSSPADCPADAPNCTPGKWKIYQIGFCTK